MSQSRSTDTAFHIRPATVLALALIASLLPAAGAAAQAPELPSMPEVPGVPTDPGELADRITPLGSRLMLTTPKRRAGGLPATVRFTGWVMPPMRLNRVEGFFQRTFGIDLGVCRGPVTVTYRSGGRVIETRRLRLNRMCAFTSSLTVRSRRALGPGGRVRATARFEGNSLLGPAQHSLAVRVG